ncbi:MAG: hypothetical protein K2X27_27390 [Candidatus Obscuribacterales bacterium]|nr:hypothetical protein [Candidatus Obscuribacterales bacterium]
MQIGDPRGSARRAVRTDEIMLLATSSDKTSRSRVAENPDSPDSLLKMMARDLNWEVRAAVALNANASLETLEFLTNDPDPNVRLTLALDSCLPNPILEMLIEDENAYVAFYARRTLEKKLSKPVELKEIKPHRSNTGSFSISGLIKKIAT